MATALPYADTVFKTVDNTMTQHLMSFASAQEQACVEREKPDYHKRLACLDAQEQELDELGELFQRADSTIVENAVQAVFAAENSKQCNSPKGRWEHPAAATNSASLSLSRELIAATGLKRAGKYAEAVQLADKVVTEVGDREPSLLASALFAKGSALVLRGDPNEGERVLLRALDIADANGNDYLRAQILVELTYVIGFEQWRGQEGLRWGRMAEHALERVGGDEPLSFRLAIGISGSHYVVGNEERSLEIGEQTLDRARRLYGDEHLLTAFFLSATGGDYANLGEPAQGLPFHEEAIAIGTKLVGDRHPEVAMYRNNLGASLTGLGRTEEAREQFETARSIWKASGSRAKEALALSNLLSLIHI